MARKSTSKKSSTKKSTPKKSTTKKKTPAKSTKSTSSKSGSSISKWITSGGGASIVIVIFVVIYSFMTGADPNEVLEQPIVQDIMEAVDGENTTSSDGGQNEPNRVNLPAGEGSQGDWWQVYFTDPNTINDPTILSGSIAEKLIGHINNAQNTIHIASFEFNYTPVAEALIAAHKRGVEVEWVTDDEHGIEADHEEDHGQFAMLEKAGIEIKDDERSALMHNKFWIFDKQTVWTGSTNITVNGMFRNNNNVIVMESPELAEIYEREFSEMWDSGEFGRRSTSTVDNQSVTIQGTPVQVYFAAEDFVAPALAELIRGAQKSVHFMAFSFTHEEMGAALADQVAIGLEVKGIFETRGSETEYSELTALYCAEAPVRQDGNPRTFHHKVLIIDGKTVATGSFNFSENADKSNDENLVIINNVDIAQRYLEEFERRWAEGRDPDPADMSCS